MAFGLLISDASVPVMPGNTPVATPSTSAPADEVSSFRVALDAQLVGIDTAAVHLPLACDAAETADALTIGGGVTLCTGDLLSMLKQWLSANAARPGPTAEVVTKSEPSCATSELSLSLPMDDLLAQLLDALDAENPEQTDQEISHELQAEVAGLLALIIGMPVDGTTKPAASDNAVPAMPVTSEQHAVRQILLRLTNGDSVSAMQRQTQPVTGGMRENLTTDQPPVLPTRTEVLATNDLTLASMMPEAVIGAREDLAQTKAVPVVVQPSKDVTETASSTPTSISTAVNEASPVAPSLPVMTEDTRPRLTEAAPIYDDLPPAERADMARFGGGDKAVIGSMDAPSADAVAAPGTRLAPARNAVLFEVPTAALQRPVDPTAAAPTVNAATIEQLASESAENEMSPILVAPVEAVDPLAPRMIKVSASSQIIDAPTVLPGAAIEMTVATVDHASADMGQGRDAWGEAQHDDTVMNLPGHAEVGTMSAHGETGNTVAVSTATSAPAAPPAHGPAHAASSIMSHWVTEQIVTAVQQELHQGQRSLTIRLDPPELGAVNLRVIAHADGQLSAQLQASSPATRDLLDARLGELRQYLVDAGLDVGHCSVSLGMQYDQAQQHFETGEHAGHRHPIMNAVPDEMPLPDLPLPPVRSMTGAVDYFA